MDDTTAIRVSTTTELLEALRAVDGTTTIELAPGKYDDVNISGWKLGDARFDAPVTIRSADPGNPAVITGLTVHSAANLAFENLVFDYTFTAGDTWRTSPFMVVNSSDVAFRGNLFDGDAGYGDDDPAWDGYPTAHGLYLRTTERAVVENNEFTGFARGFKALTVQDLSLSHNEFHGQRMDHAVFAEVQDVMIASNVMRDHDAPPDSIDHRDMIQFWNDNTNVPSRNVTIHDNLMILGENDVETQSIFIGNGKVTRSGEGPEWYWQNFVITENVIVNGHKHGILIDYVDGAYIANNTLLREDVVSGDGALYTPGIVLAPESRNVTLLDNVTPRLIGPEGQADWLVQGNVLIQDEDPLAPGYYGDIFVNPLPGERSNLDNIQIDPDGPLGDSGAGTARLAYEAASDTLTALLRHHRDDAAWTDYTFDAMLSAGPDGPLDDGMTASWDFGDGTTATGPVVAHGYTAPGSYTVTLTVEAPNGARSVTTTRVEVGDPAVLRLDTDLGQFDLGTAAAQDVLLEDVTAGGVTRKAMVFDAGDDQVMVAHSALSGLEGAQDLTIALTLSSADWGANHVDRQSGEVLRYGGTFLRIEADGTPLVRFETQDTAPVVLRGDTALGIDAWHDLEIVFDGRGGTLALRLDGAEIGRADLAGSLPDTARTGLSFGHVWSNTAFSGAIAAVEVSADAAAYTRLQAPGPAPSAPVGAAFFTGFDVGAALADPEGPVTPVGGLAAGADGMLAFDGHDDMLLIDRIEMLDPAPRLTLELDWQRASADGGDARLAWFHQRVGVELVEDGIGLRLRTADGTMDYIQIDGLGLDDTDWHSLTLEVDSTTDVVRLNLDGDLVYAGQDIDVALDDPGLATVWEWRFGGAWGHHFEGQMSNLRLATDGPDLGAPEGMSGPARITLGAPDTLLRFEGDAVYDRATGRVALDGAGDAIVLADAGPAFDGGQLTLDLDWRRSVADDTPVRLFWDPQRLGVELYGDGIVLRASTVDGSMQRFAIPGLGLDDTAWHSLRLHVDSAADSIGLELADELIFVKSGLGLSVDLDGTPRRGEMTVGGKWSGYLDGEIGTIDLVAATEADWMLPLA